MAFPSTGYSSIAAAQSDGVVHYWPMDEESGTAVADVVGGLNGTVVGGDAVVAGKFGNGRRMGVDAGEARGIAIWDTGTKSSADEIAQWSVSQWIRWRSFSAAAVMQLGGTAPDYLRVAGAVTQTVRVVYGSSWNFKGADGLITDDSWRHLVITSNGTTVSAYLDGALIGSGSGAQPLRLKNEYSTLASEYLVADQFYTIGLHDIDDVAIWSRALTQAETQAIYNGGTGVSVVASEPEWPSGIIELTVAAQVGTSIAGEISVQVAAVQHISGAIRIDVIDPSVIGDPSGAGEWTAAPEGRWEAHVWIGDDWVSDRIEGELTITREDDAAAIAEFGIVPVAPMEPLSLIKKRVQIGFAQVGGENAQQMFVGIIERADYDVQTGRIKIDCTDGLQRAVDKMGQSRIDTLIGGSYSVHVSGDPTGGWAYAQERLKSTQKSLAMDVSGAVRALPWRGMTRALDVTQEDVLDGSVSVSLPSASDVVTRVTVRMQYRYQRLRSRGALLSLSLPMSTFASYAPVTGLTLRQWLTVGMVEQAITGLSGWALADNPVIAQPAADTYFASGSFGGYTVAPQVAVTLATGFVAHYQARWVQSVTETYEIEFVAAGVESQLGDFDGETMGANVSAGSPPSDWASDISVAPLIATPIAGDAMMAWQPSGATTADRDDAIVALREQAKTRIVGSFRTGRVTFALPLRPDLWLDVWASLSAYGVTTAGKVGSVRHSMNTATGEAITSASITVGLIGDPVSGSGGAVIPSLPTENLMRPLTAYSVECGVYVGGENDSPPFDEGTMIGFATNRFRTGAAGEESYNYYPNQLSLRAPDIEAVDRDPVELSAKQNVRVSIPADVLEIA